MAKAALLAIMLFGSMLAVMLFSPAGNDYALATVDKHARLRRIAEPKIVFVGGSNLSFGLDSEMVSRECGAPIVNMGMNGYLGVRFMMDEVKDTLKPSDTVILSFEYDSYYKSADGTGRDLLMIAKARPSALRVLTLAQWGNLFEAVPLGLQQKVFRVTKTAIHNVVAKLPVTAVTHASAPPPEPVDGVLPEYNWSLIAKIESRAGFNEYGDMTNHLDVPWPYQKEDGDDISHLPIDPGVVEVMRQFTSEMKARGVRVILLHTSLLQSYYDRHRESIWRLHKVLQKAMPDHVISSPERYVLPEPLFFDTVYHVNREGRAVRTQRVIEDIKAQAGAACHPKSPLSN